MSDSDGILSWAGEIAASETVVLKGEKRDRGIGFKLTSDGNSDLQNKIKHSIYRHSR